MGIRCIGVRYIRVWLYEFLVQVASWIESLGFSWSQAIPVIGRIIYAWAVGAI